MKQKRTIVIIIKTFLFCALWLNGFFAYLQVQPVEEKTPSICLSEKIQKRKLDEDKVLLITEEVKQNENQFKAQRLPIVVELLTIQRSGETKTAIFLQMLEKLQFYQNDLFHLLC